MTTLVENPDDIKLGMVEGNGLPRGTRCNRRSVTPQAPSVP